MSKNIRLNQELLFLKDKHQFQLKDLMAAFQISKRTALRDIAELEAMGLALYAETGRGGGYRLLPQNLLVPITITQSELSAIFYALKALEKVSTTPFDNTYPAIIEKLLANLTPAQISQLEQTMAVIDHYTVAAVNRPRYLPEILQAILEETVTCIHYTQHGEEELTVQFYDLFYRQGVWFCHGFQPAGEQWAIYRCDYIQSLTIDKDCQGRTRQDLGELLDQHEKAFRYIPFRCRLTPFGKELFLKNHYEAMSLTEEGDCLYLDGFYNPSELHYLTHYLLEFGSHLTVEAPDEVKAAYVSELQEMISRYE